MELLGIVGKENDTHKRNIFIKDLKGLDSQIGVLNLYFKRNITFKDLFDKDIQLYISDGHSCNRSELFELLGLELGFAVI